MRELTDDQKKAATDLLKLSGEELRWRMEKVVQHTSQTGMDIESTAKDFIKALRALKEADAPAFEA